MTDSTGDEADALRTELARLLAGMTAAELKTLLRAIAQVERARRGEKRPRPVRANHNGNRRRVI
jgi:hypothetical protein